MLITTRISSLGFPAWQRAVATATAVILALVLPARATVNVTLAAPENAAARSRLNLDVVDADLRDVFVLLARVGGASLVLDPSVPGRRVTLSLHDVHWDQALEEVARVHGLGVSREPVARRIAPDADRAAALPEEIELIPPPRRIDPPELLVAARLVEVPQALADALPEHGSFVTGPLHAGAGFRPLALSPADALWLEQRLSGDGVRLLDVVGLTAARDESVQLDLSFLEPPDRKEQALVITLSPRVDGDRVVLTVKARLASDPGTRTRAGWYAPTLAVQAVVLPGGGPGRVRVLMLSLTEGS